jgi:hypothetical protein
MVTDGRLLQMGFAWVHNNDLRFNDLRSPINPVVDGVHAFRASLCLNLCKSLLEYRGSFVS